MIEDFSKLFSNIKFLPEDSYEVGIDEAGRGPAIGPMVYALYVMPKGVKTKYKDSKLLTPKQRENFLASMSNYSYVSIDPVYITSFMDFGNKNLNIIAKEAVIKLLADLESKISCNPSKITAFIDGLGNNEEYERLLEKHFCFNFRIENKADSTYQVVSGASIIAKCVRDALVSKYNCGSGYPSDPNTKKWLMMQKSATFPPYVRHSWKTIKAFFPLRKSSALKESLFDFYPS